MMERDGNEKSSHGHVKSSKEAFEDDIDVMEKKMDYCAYVLGILQLLAFSIVSSFDIRILLPADCQLLILTESSIGMLMDDRVGWCCVCCTPASNMGIMRKGGSKT